MTRGCRTRLFQLDLAQGEPDSYDKEFSEAEIWNHYEYFIKRVLPVAEDAGVSCEA